MRWFQVDSNTPDDPKIRTVLAKFGNEGLGMLLRLWCFIAAHGTTPGWSLDSQGKPIDKAMLVEATGGSEQNFDKLLRECDRNGHIHKHRLNRKLVVELPAMSRRADPYTKERLRRNCADTAQQLCLQDKTIQDSTNKNPLNPPLKGGRLTRAQLKAAAERRKRCFGGCPHEPRCATYATCVAQLARETVES